MIDKSRLDNPRRAVHGLLAGPIVEEHFGEINKLQISAWDEIDGSHENRH